VDAVIAADENSIPGAGRLFANGRHVTSRRAMMREEELQELARNWLNSVFTGKVYGPSHPTVKNLATLLLMVELRAGWTEEQREAQRKKLGKQWVMPY
jgi:hypothetical protein